MTSQDILDAKLGDSQVSAIYLGDDLVWPTAVTYVITEAYIGYTDTNSNYILASGANYAYAYGTVQPYMNGEPYGDPIPNVTLTVTITEHPQFYVQNNEIHGYDLGTVPYSSTSTTAFATYHGSAQVQIVAPVYQQENVAGEWDYTPDYVYGTPFDGDPENDRYVVEVHLRNYSAVSVQAPASGDVYAGVDYTASHRQTIRTYTPTDEYRTPYRVWTSNTTEYGERFLYSSTDVETGSTTTTINDYSRVVITVDNVSFTWDSTNKQVYIPSEGALPYDSGLGYGRRVKVLGTNGTATHFQYIYQEVNEIESTVNDPRDITSAPQSRTRPHDAVTVITLNQYDSEEDAAAAGERNATLTCYGYHWVETTEYVVITPCYVPVYTWTSGATSEDEPVYDGDPYESITDQYDEQTDNYALTLVEPDVDWLSVSGTPLNGATVTISSRGTSESNDYRSAVYSATNTSVEGDSVYNEVTIYQEPNIKTYLRSVTDMDVDIQYDGELPSSGGIFGVVYRSLITRFYIFSSQEPWSEDDEIASAVSTTNCSTETTSVHGRGAFLIEIGANTVSGYTVGVRLTYGGETVSDMRTQDSSAVTPTGIVASILPVVMPGGSDAGYTFASFSVTHGTLASTTISAVTFHYYSPSGSSTERTRNVGTLTVRDGELTAISSSLIPRFANGSSVKCWFTVGNTGDVDTMNCPEPTYTVTYNS